MAGQAEQQVAATVAAMRRLIRRSSDDPTVGAAVAWLKRKFGAQPAQYVAGAWRFMGAVPYQYDPPGVELVRSPDQFVRQLGQLAGDCDDQVVTLGALLHHAAAPTRPDPLQLATVSTRPDRTPHHVFLTWRGIPLDPIMNTGGREHEATRHRPPGWWIGNEQPVTALQLTEV